MSHTDGPAPQAKTWGKSAYSTNGGDCAEAAIHPDGVDLRHSKHPDGPTLRFTPDEYVAYYLGMINGDPNVTPPAEWITRFLAKQPGAEIDAKDASALGQHQVSTAPRTDGT